MRLIPVYTHHFSSSSSLSLPSLPGISWKLIPAQKKGPISHHLWWGPKGLFWASPTGLWRPPLKQYWEYWQREDPLPQTSLLGKALGLKKGKKLKILDATFGTGRDALLLLWWGQDVYGGERNPLLFVLLQEASKDLLQDNLFKKEEVKKRFYFSYGEASTLFQETAFDRIYFDPMYPKEGRKKTAFPKKGMANLKRLLESESSTDAKEVFLRLWKRCPFLVVKRGLHSPPLLSGVNALWKGKSLRLDKYLRPSL